MTKNPILSNMRSTLLGPAETAGMPAVPRDRQDSGAFVESYQPDVQDLVLEQCGTQEMIEKNRFTSLCS